MVSGEGVLVTGSLVRIKVPRAGVGQGRDPGDHVGFVPSHLSRVNSVNSTVMGRVSVTIVAAVVLGP